MVPITATNRKMPRPETFARPSRIAPAAPMFRPDPIFLTDSPNDRPLLPDRPRQSGPWPRDLAARPRPRRRGRRRTVPRIPAGRDAGVRQRAPEAVDL